MSETDTDQLENTKNQEDEEFDLDAFTDDDDESSRILNQDEIDSLLGFDDEDISL